MNRLRNPAAAAVLVSAVWATVTPAMAQLRFATYNTLDKPLNSTADTQFKTIFGAIANTTFNGIAKRVDILALQEQTPTSANRISGLLNDLHGVSTYQTSVIGRGMDRVAMVYDSATVDLLGVTLVSTGGPRPTHRAHLRPASYTSADAEFYLYTAHLKAGTDDDDRNERATEAANLRFNSDNLGSDKHIVYAGDFNIQFATEFGYLNMVAPGNAQAKDPIQVSLSWHNNNNPAVVGTHTQSTRTSNLPDGGVNGGMDDRFDWQFNTAALLDGEGLSYIGPTSTGLEDLDHSYRAFGNDGVSFNQRINNTFNGRSQTATVLNALHDFSDHLPVIADYQLPAVMSATISQVPATVTLGSLEQLTVQVENIAAATVAAGADKLDYDLTLSENLSGAASGTAEAQGGPKAHLVTLNTASPGLKNGTVTISSTSEAVGNALFSFPISYEVIAALLVGDANNDSQVTGLDLIAVQQGFGDVEQGPPTGMLTGDANDDGLVTGLDLITVQENFGQALTAPATVPEPTGMLAVMAVAMVALRRGR